jgi:hypothetical protein
MAKMKFDFKQFLMQKGERVGLGVALGLMAVLVLLGIFGALSASSPAKDLSKAADELQASLNRRDGDDKTTDIAVPQIKEYYPGVDSDRLRMVQMFDPTGAGNPKRTSPTVLAPDFDAIDKSPVAKAQIDVVYTGWREFDFNEKRILYHAEGGNKNLVGGKGGLPGGIPGGVGGKGAVPPPGMLGKGGNVGSSGDKHYVEKMEPGQMVVVSATFPLKQQLELISKALRYNSVKEMFEAGGTDAQPEFGGLIVLRREFGADGKLSNWKDLKLDDKVEPTMKQYAKFIGFEPEDEEQLKHIFPGVVMPRPPSMTAEYPLVKLEGIPPGEKHAKKIRDDATNGKKVVGGGMPGQPGMPGGPPGGTGFGGRGGVPGVGQPQAGGSTNLQFQDIKELPKEYEGPETPTQAKFDRLFDIFEVGGFPRDPSNEPAPTAVGKGNAPGEMDPRMAAKMKSAMGIGETMKGGGRSGAAQQSGRTEGVSPDKSPEKALIRFVDVDVKPGHTYQYMFKVKLRNPNFKKKTYEVASATMARKEFLESPFVFTQPVHVGQQIFFYNVDQVLTEERQDFLSKHIKRIDTTYPAPADKVPIQIHRFVMQVETKGPPANVCDWAIAERVLVPRGEYIGHAMEVELPYWNKTLEEFDLVNGRMDTFTRKKQGFAVVDFSTRNDKEAQALVVDFRGGKTLAEESTTELLVLRKDGKLEVMNSRVDTDPQYPRALERITRLEHMRTRVHDVKQPPQQPQFAPGGGKGGPGS